MSKLESLYNTIIRQTTKDSITMNSLKTILYINNIPFALLIDNGKVCILNRHFTNTRIY